MLSRARKLDLMRSLAFLGLLGFVSQYPIPGLHRCPQLDPGAGMDLHSVHKAQPSSQSNQVAQQGEYSAPETAAEPDPHAHCHSKKLDHSGSSSHQHSSCPVCQGYLLAGLIYHSAPMPLLAVEQTSRPTVAIQYQGPQKRKISIREILARPPPA